MARLKVWLGFCLAPLMTPATFVVGSLIAFGDPPELNWEENVVSAVLLTGPYAFAVTLLLGVPGYYLLLSCGWLKAWVVLLAGGSLGLLAGMIIDGRFAPLVILCGLSGIMSASCFWLIACRKPAGYQGIKS